MGSEQNDSTSFPPSEPPLCANGCGFFGSPSNMNLCSKCYRDIRLKEDQAAAAKSAFEKSFTPSNLHVLKPQQEESVPAVSSDSAAVAESSEATAVVELASSGGGSGGDGAERPSRAVAANRCYSCNKKVGLMGFKCRCGSTFCGIHRYPEKHECEFDFKESGRDAIAKANPVVKADKVQKI